MLSARLSEGIKSWKHVVTSIMKNEVYIMARVFILLTLANVLKNSVPHAVILNLLLKTKKKKFFGNRHTKSTAPKRG